MRNLICLLTATSLAFLTGCGDSGPLDSTDSDDLIAPAGKITRSRTPAGGYKPGMLKLTGTGVAANAATNNGPSSGCPEGWTPRDMAGAGQMTVLGNYTFSMSHCAAPNRLSFRNGEFVYVTEPGDELHGTYQGGVTVAAGIEFTNQFRITGGTGRLAGASGYVYQYGPLIPGEGAGGNAVDAIADGWIKIPGSQPMNGDMIGQVIPDEDPASVARCAGDMARIFEVRGQTSMTDDYTLVGRHCFSISDIINFEPGGTVGINRGFGSLISADGEEVHGTYVGVYYPDNATFATGAVTMAITWIGGTGRLAGATGASTGRGYSSGGADGLRATFKGGIAVGN